MNVSHQILNNLLQIKAIQLSPQKPFVWASGLHSPIYCDNRLSLSYPHIRKLVIKGFIGLMSDYPKPDIIVGVATAGIAHGALLAHELDLPFAYVRSKKKAHGKQNAIEGEIHKNQRCLVIEDLISTGGSSITAAQAIVESGAEVLSILSIFNYNLSKAIDNFAQSGIAFGSICDYNDLMELMRKEGQLEDDKIALLSEWSKSPQAWSEQYLKNETD